MKVDLYTIEHQIPPENLKWATDHNNTKASTLVILKRDDVMKIFSTIQKLDPLGPEKVMCERILSRSCVL